MDIVETSQMIRGLNICVDINSHIGESNACMRRALKTTNEGLMMARKLMCAAVEMKDLKLMKNTYTLVKKLKPSADLMDSVEYSMIQNMYNGFNKYVVQLIRSNPRFVFRYLLVDMNNQKFNCQSAQKRQEIDKNIVIVYQQLLMPHINNVRG